MTMIPWWRPDQFAKKRPYLEARADILRRIRSFFDEREYLEVETPALSTAPCPEAHIMGFETKLFTPDRLLSRTMYLHTSPEFAMKKLLVAGLPKIYQICHVFRNAEGSSQHTPEFSMIEWYQAGLSYEGLMQECVDLLRAVADRPFFGLGKVSDPHGEWEFITVADAFKKYAKLDLDDYTDDEDAFFKIMGEVIEPQLGSPVPTVIYDYPASMAALSRVKPSDPRYAERFEIYVCGVELANAFGELTDAVEQRKRYAEAMEIQKERYGFNYPIEEDFLKALEHGMPEASGIALGIDRLVMLATGAEDISLVQAAPVG